MSQYLSQVVPIIMEVLRNPDTDRQVKLVAIGALSDLALQTNKFFVPYLMDVLDMLKSASELATQPISDDDPELPLYVQQLKECLVDSYTGIVYGMKEANDRTGLQNYSRGIFQFLAVICADVESINIEFLRSVCGLVGDIADFIGPSVRSYLGDHFIQKMIKRLEASPSKEHRTVATWATTSISKALK